MTDIAGIGKGIASVLVEIAQRGSFERRDEMLARYPASALELLKIQGLGPKSIALLFQHHGVKNIDDLERICREQKLRDLPRMGAKLEEKVLRSIESYRKSAGRFLLNFGRRDRASRYPRNWQPFRVSSGSRPPAVSGAGKKPLVTSTCS